MPLPVKTQGKVSVFHLSPISTGFRSSLDRSQSRYLEDIRCGAFDKRKIPTTVGVVRSSIFPKSTSGIHLELFILSQTSHILSYGHIPHTVIQRFLEEFSHPRNLKSLHFHHQVAKSDSVNSAKKQLIHQQIKTKSKTLIFTLIIEVACVPIIINSDLEIQTLPHINTHCASSCVNFKKIFI